MMGGREGRKERRKERGQGGQGRWAVEERIRFGSIWGGQTVAPPAQIMKCGKF